MSDKMMPIPFGKLMGWILEEKQSKGTVFGIHKPFQAAPEHVWKIFGSNLEMPFGPAAGPHTQLAQNLVAAYYAGSRFFELKTVQKIDGEDLPVAKPCINAADEGYNVEWSTELYVPQAFDEYVKAWFAIKVIAREYGLGAMDGFQFNMSVGYDLPGIQLEKIDRFIEGLKDAGQTAVFRECQRWLQENSGLFQVFKAEDIQGISPEICRSVTLSTLHGCPPQEIERIATYLLVEKQLHTFVKCNPTLLGYDYARKILNEMGYDYVSFGEFHFTDDLQYRDAVPMLERLMQIAKAQNLEFGVKITNTFPVEIKDNELPGSEMYMSGKPLFPLAMSVAAKLSADFGGRLKISYSGGADYYNIEKIVDAGIWPVTLATSLLKPGGYQRLTQIAEKFARLQPRPFDRVDAAAAAELVESARSSRHYLKPLKPLPSRKIARRVPLLDCFIAPCQDGCPINQDISAYLKLAREGRMKEALQVIIEKNPLPFITGTICPHHCMSKCTRNFYESSVNIRRTKLEAARGGFAELMAGIEKPEVTGGKQTAIVGGGPAGLAAAYFLAKNGMRVTIFEKREKLGGLVRYVIPGFRIPDEAIESDIKLIKAMGVQIKTGIEITSIEKLQQDYDHIVLALGASDPGVLRLKQGSALNALDFLESFKSTGGKVPIGKEVIVIGGGNTAMDVARAAIRNEGVEKVSLVYRRTKRFMPADEEELLLALADQVEFWELLAPESIEGCSLHCRRMKLGDMDANGRRNVVETGETACLAADTVISAVGEQIPVQFYQNNGIPLDSTGRVIVNPDTLETRRKRVYAIGDGLNGPASVVEGIRDARMAAEGILQKPVAIDYDSPGSLNQFYDNKGRMTEESSEISDSCRCLNCSSICENCVEVCPNRANIAVLVPGMARHQIIHIDAMCNECGNCQSFCPYSSAPYLDKFTLFASEPDMHESKNQGFAVVDRPTGRCRVRLDGEIFDYIEAGAGRDLLPLGLQQLIASVIRDYSYLL